MSIGMYRSTVERLTKDKANLEKELAQERDKLSKLQNDIASISRSISSSTSVSLRQSKQRQINSKQDDVARCQKKIAELEGKIASKLSELYRNLSSLNRAEDQGQRKIDAEAKKRQDQEIRHSREVTRELERQAHLQSVLRSNRLVIDLARLPTTIKVLFLAANPQDQTELRLDEEIRAITEKIRLSDYRDSVELISRWAVRPADLLQALNEHKPQIVHFSGHGLQTGEIVLQADDGGTKLVTQEAIAATISTMTDSIRLVIFNACFSREQAEAVTRHIEAAIGMNTDIGDEAARVFAAQFYSAIGFGRSVQSAFEQAKALLMLENIPEEDTPELFTREGVDPNELILVQPVP
jgi:hypothetical protein